jgi:two-component system sensor histidine kinase QseC
MAVGVYWVLGKNLAPVTRLSEQIRQRSAEDLEAVATEKLPLELLPIGESVNNLFSRLRESLDRQSRFTADAAHELRTPLTALKTNAQVALETTDEQLRRTTLRKIVGTINRTSRLISQLLTLARLDPRVTKEHTTCVDLGSCARETIAELDVATWPHCQKLHLDISAGVFVKGESDALCIMIRNIVENALQYSISAREGQVDLRVFRDGTQSVIEVEDRGPGIPETEKAEVFQRFRRLSGAVGFGTGLGLSIVQRIVDLHGASIALNDPRVGQGLCVRVEFPSCDAEARVPV